MKRMIIAAACVLLAGPALAQSLGEKTGVNSALGVAPATADFVKEVAISDMFEIEFEQARRAEGQRAGEDLCAADGDRPHQDQQRT